MKKKDKNNIIKFGSLESTFNLFRSNKRIVTTAVATDNGKIVRNNSVVPIVQDGKSNNKIFNLSLTPSSSLSSLSTSSCNSSFESL